MYKINTSLFIAAILLFSLTGCKKDAVAPVIQQPPAPSPLLISVDYNDDYPTEVHHTLQYDTDQRLQQLRSTYSTGGTTNGYYRRYTWNGKEVNSKEFFLDDTEVPHSDATFQITLNNF